jgi:hypothetical protein
LGESFLQDSVLLECLVSPSDKTHGEEIGQFWTKSSQKQRGNFPPHFEKALPHIFSTRFLRKKEIV